MLLPKFQRKGLTPAQMERRDERALNRLRRILRGRLRSVRSQLDITGLCAAIDAAEDENISGAKHTERVLLEDRTLIGGIPSEFVYEQLGCEIAPDPEALMLVAEQAPLYQFGVDDAGLDDEEPILEVEPAE